MLNETFLNVLNIDLEKKRFFIEQREDLYREYMGGTGAATKLLEEQVLAGTHPLDAGQPIIFAIGPLTFIFPMMTKVVAMFKSPLTGELGETHAGLRMGMTMRMAGYDAIAIKGRSQKPLFLTITGRDVKFHDASPLWGMDVDTTGLYLREAVPGSGKRCILRIGPAGERLVSSACVTVDDFRHFGRLGLGALMGSKNLKGIVISSDRDYLIPNLPEYKKLYEEIYQVITGTHILQKYHDLGTPENIVPLNMQGGLPTRNLQSTRFEEAEKISGESFAEEVLVKKLSCSGCPVGCIHIASLKHQFSAEHEYETLYLGYDYELIYALGSLLGISSKQDILNLILSVEKLGLDAMMAGVILSWATEGFQTGVLSKDTLLASPSFGGADEYIKILNNLVRQPNDFYRLLAENPDECARKFGGSEFLLTLKGNGVAGYHTGYAALFGQTIGSRHSHLDNAGYSIDQKHEALTPEALVQKIIDEEKERGMVTSLVMCMFARKVYDRELISRALGSLGYSWNKEELTALGERIYQKKISLKKSFGYDFKNLGIPERFFQTESGQGRLERSKIEEYNRIYLEKLAIE